LMKDYGGFEGNAQTLRILTVLEKKQYVVDQIKNDIEVDDYSGITSSGEDVRRGLNLTMRSLASVLKYDKILLEEEEIDQNQNLIPENKGYYKTESSFVNIVKQKVSPLLDGKLYTVECQIMDLADDIAYSTYDLEDSFKGGFLHPMLIHSMGNKFMNLVVREVNKSLRKKGIEKEASIQDIQNTIDELINLPKVAFNTPEDQARYTLRTSLDYAEIGYLRTQFASKSISTFINRIQIDYNNESPELSQVILDEESRKKIEILKKISFLSQIESTRLKVVETRGQNIVEDLFKLLTNDKKNKNGELLPTDVRKIYSKSSLIYQKRIVCDFIASMTNRYAEDYLDRLTSVNSTKSLWSLRG